MSNWGQDISNSFNSAFQNSKELAFRKWQTQQETQAKMFESGFIPTTADDTSPNTASLFGQKFKFSPQIAAMKMAPWLAMTPGGMDMLNGMAKGTAEGSGLPSMPGMSGMPSIPGQGLPPMNSNAPQGTPGLMSQGLQQLGQVPPEMMMKFPGMEVNPNAQAALKSQMGIEQSQAENVNKTLLEGKYKALQGALKDTSTLNLMGNSLKGLMGAYDEAKKGGFAGNWYIDQYGQKVSSGQLPMLPGQTVPGGQAANRFVAARNESIMRMQPIMSEQFGERGSMRIMQSMIAMGQQELGSLNEPRWAIAGKAEGTLQNLYRFLKGSADYAKKMNITPDKLNNMSDEDIQNFVKGSINFKGSALSKEEEVALRQFTQEVTGERKPSPKGATHYSASQDKYYDAKGNEVK